MTKTYPISLVLTDKVVVVIGGGEVAARKVKGLQGCQARITVISPQVTSELQQLIDQGVCQWVHKAYELSDLAGAELVFVCTDDQEVNQRVSKDATRYHLLVNVADQPELCSFYLPSVLRKEALTVAVSTDGSAPLAAKLIRKDIEEYLGSGHTDYLLLMKSWRKKVLATLTAQQRETFWQRAVEEQVYELVKSGRLGEAKDVLTGIYSSLG